MKEANKSHGAKICFLKQTWLVWTSIRLLRNVLVQAVPASEQALYLT